MNFANRRLPVVLSASVMTLVVIGSLVVAHAPAWAGPLTGGTGNPPYPKLSIYQGIAVIAPTSAGSLKLGANGTDISADASIRLVPGNGGVVTVSPYTGVSYDGRLTLVSPGGAFPDWSIDAFAGNARFLSGTTDKLNIGQNGNLTIRGSLCLNASGCHARFSDVTGSGTPNQTLDQTLAIGNTAYTAPTWYTTYNNLLWEGQYESPGAHYGDYLLGFANSTVYDSAAYDTVNQFLSGSSLDSIAARSNKPLGLSSGSAVYATNPNGVAGFFQGNFGVYGPGAGNPTFLPESLARFVGNIPPTTSGYVLDVYNQSQTGYAAVFNDGSSVITGSGAGGVNPEATLLVRNTSPTGGTTIYLHRGGIAGYLYGGSTNGAGNVTYGLYAQAGTPSGGATSYAGWFHGSVLADAYQVLAPGAGSWGLRFQGSAQAKTKTDVWVCPVGSDDCSAYGRYVRTECGSPSTECTAANYSDKANLKYCYDTGSSVVCANVYGSTPSYNCSGCGGNPWQIFYRSPSGSSYYPQAACASFEYVPASNRTPYGASSVPTCIDTTTSYSALPVSFQAGGACQNYNSSNFTQNRVNDACVRSTTVPGSLLLELR